MFIKRYVVFALLLMLLAALPLSAANRFWTGAVNGNWSEPGNWGGTAPVAGDTLYFYATGNNKTTNNDLPAGTRINGIVAEEGYTLQGNAIDLGADLRIGSTTVVTLPIRLVTSILVMATGTITVASPINLNGHVITALTTNGTVVLNGIISGDGQIVKNDGGGTISNLVLAGNNTYTGYTRVNGGRLIVPNANGLGAGSNNLLNRTIIYNGGSLIVQNALIGESLEIGGPGFLNEGALQTTGSTIFNGGLRLTEQTRAVIEGTLGIHGQITGPGGLTLDGSGDLTLYFSGNDFAGPLQWLSSSSGVDIIAGADNVLPTTLDLVIPAPASVRLNGHVQRLRSISGYGVIALNSLSTDGELLLTNATGVWDGQIIGAGNFTVLTGAMEIVDANIVSGEFGNDGATITLRGSGSFSDTTDYLQNAGATIITEGGRFFGPVAISAGELRIPGVAHSGNLSLTNDATYVETIAGPASTAYGNLHVTGTVNLGGANFTLNQTGIVPAGPLVILDNDGADPVTGTFAGLPEGAAIVSGMQSFTITYAAGTGNDVALIALPVDTTTALTSAPNPSTAGQNVTLTATVTADSGIATGTVAFFDGGTPLGTAPLNASGVATLTIDTLTAGTHNLTAQYGGNTTFNGSASAAHVHTVSAALATTTTTLTSSPNPSLIGQNVTFTATVTSPSPGTPTGTITFRDGATVLGTVALTNGTATFSTSTLTAGSHSITATYNGDDAFATSTSPAVTQVVAAAPGQADIPALDGRGLAALAIVLAAVAMLVLRR